MFKEAKYEMDKEVGKAFIENGTKQWFQTKTAKSMARGFYKHKT
jgi:hypothetical protein